MLQFYLLIYYFSTAPKKTKQQYYNLVPDSDGLFWCKTCLRYFRKSRQLMQHVCFDLEDEVCSILITLFLYIILLDHSKSIHKV